MRSSELTDAVDDATSTSTDASPADIHRPASADGVIPLPPRSRWARVAAAIDPVTQLTRIAVVAGFLLLWRHAVNAEWIEPLFAAGPGETADSIRDLLTERLFWDDLIVTMRESLVGWAIGSTLGVLAGLVLGRWKRLSKAFGPFLTFVNATPKVALAPIFILWFGIGEASKIFTASIVVFFIVQVPTQAASALVDPDLEVMARTLGANQFRRFTKIVLPGMMPAIFGALRLSAVLSLLVVVFTEFIASRRGLGQRLIAATNQFDMGVAFAVMVVLAVMALWVNAAIGVVERRVLRWQESSTSGSIAML